MRINLLMVSVLLVSSSTGRHIKSIPEDKLALTFRIFTYFWYVFPHSVALFQTIERTLFANGIKLLSKTFSGGR